MNTYQHQTIQADHRRNELMREAQASRLSQPDNQPALTDRLLANVGEWMVAEGTRLKERQKLAVSNPRFRIGGVEG